MMTGTGTNADPIMLASDHSEFNSCDIIYTPLFQKYFYKGDSCQHCSTDWGNWGNCYHVDHVDLWSGSTYLNGGQDQINCEDNLPGGKQLIVREPPSDLPANSKLHTI
jgi:hypothetical protein